MKVTKANLIVDLAEDVGATKKEAGALFESVVGCIERQLRAGNSVEISGFGQFVVSERAARVARNPRDGTPIDVPAATVVKFRPAKALKDGVNSKQ